VADLPVIDADAHINEPIDVFADFLDDEHRELRPRLITDTRGLTRILMDGKLYPETRLRQNHVKKVQGTQLGGMQKGASDPIARLDDMDSDGIDVQVLYGSLGLSVSTIEDVEFAIAKGRAPFAASQRVGLHWIKAKPVSSHAITGRPRTSRRHRCRCPYAVRACRNHPQRHDGDRTGKTMRR